MWEHVIGLSYDKPSTEHETFVATTQIAASNIGRLQKNLKPPPWGRINTEVWECHIALDESKGIGECVFIYERHFCP